MRGLCLALFVAATLSAHKAPSKQDQILEKLDQVAKDQARIRKILEEADQPPPARPTHAKVNIAGAPALGTEDAPITIVEFTDFQCPFCSKFHLETFPKLHDEFIATGKVRWVHRNLPLPATVHPNAFHAAEAGKCAREQSHFWELRDWMQSNPEKLENTLLLAKARDLDLDMAQFGNCLAIDKYKEDLEKEVKEAQDLGINGTPAFVIGKALADASEVEGDVIVGNQPIAAFERAILALKDSIAK